MEQAFQTFLVCMSLVALLVFIALFFVKAGYGKFVSAKWGPSISNKLGWVLMESPVFVLMIFLWFQSERGVETVPFVIFCFFQIHYFQRAFLFPLLLKGKSRMPLAIILMGATFNTLNACMQGGWLFYIAPANYYSIEWLYTPQFIIGTLLFFTGMFINIQSDSIIRNLRKPSDTRHYLPAGGVYNYVTSANYLGEIIEWCGFALLTWSWAGAVFAWWTIANLVPRAAAIHTGYRAEFGQEVKNRKLKRIIPGIY